MTKGVPQYLVGVVAGSMSSLIHQQHALPFGLRIGLGLLLVAIFMRVAVGPGEAQ